MIYIYFIIARYVNVKKYTEDDGIIQVVKSTTTPTKTFSYKDLEITDPEYIVN